MFLLGSRAGPSLRPPTRERAPNFGAKIDIYIYMWRYWKNIVLHFSSSFKKSQRIEYINAKDNTILNI